ncbi:hypothetical protein [Streptomyces longisporoflavus]|uniref:Integral membrane protein n=1 Tax=Streptomyces longisporoflavus TaxID=28044 RepID=A0ABW7QPR4_9ACTN
MRALKRWLDRSLVAQAALIFLLGTGATALFRRNEHPVVWVTQGVLYSAIVIAFVAVQRRKAGRAAGTDARGVAELNRKIRHREVPRDPEERASMRRLVAAHLGQMEQGSRWLPYWLGAMGLVAAGILVLGAATGSLLYPLVVGGGLIAFCCWALWMRRRSLDRCHYMRAALQN